MDVRLARSRRDRMLAALKRGSALASLVAGVIAGDPARADDPPPNGLSGTFGEGAGTPDIVPSSGAMAYSVPFALPSARGAAQPSLSLVYASGASGGEAGHGWFLNLPAIERAPLSGWPKYRDPITDYAPGDEDRYAYDGKPLTYICTVGGYPACPSDEQVGPMPSWATAYRHYRLQVEGSFDRFFQSADRSRWIVQKRGGEVLEFGIPLTRSDFTAPNANDVDAVTGKIFRWNLVRQRDLHGELNLAVYQWAGGLRERKYLRHIYYTPPADNTTAASLDDYSYHVELSWANPPYRQEDFTLADKWRFYKRLHRVAISSKTWSDAGSRELVRAYNLEYYGERTVPGASGEAPFWGKSSLRSVQMEGRCTAPIAEIGGIIPDPTGCPTLPAMTFEYQNAVLASGTAVEAQRTGPPGGDPYVLSTAVTDLNRDGLPDIVESWPQNRGSLRFTECQGANAAYIVMAPDGECVDDHAPGAPPYVCHPKLACNDPDPDEGIHQLRSARAQRAWINVGPGVAGGVFLRHNCLDAGDGSSKTVTGYHILGGGTGSALSRNAALFTQFGAEAIGDWGDAAILWSIAGYQGFRVRPFVPDDPEDTITPENWQEFCPESTGVPNSYPALKWEKVDDSAVWVKYPNFSAEMSTYHSLVDIDGDGYSDLLTDPDSPIDSGSFRRAAVKFTRKTTGLETLNGVHGPMLLPFGQSDSAAITISPTGQDYSTYADVNGDGILDLVTARNAVAGGTPEVRLGDGRGGFGCNASLDVACNVFGDATWVGPAYRLFSPDATAHGPCSTLRSRISRTSFTM